MDVLITLIACGDHFTMYMNIRSSLSIILIVNYTTLKLGKKKESVMNLIQCPFMESTDRIDNEDSTFSL